MFTHVSHRGGIFARAFAWLMVAWILRIKENQRYIHEERVKENFNTGVRNSSKTTLPGFSGTWKQHIFNLRYM